MLSVDALMFFIQDPALHKARPFVAGKTVRQCDRQSFTSLSILKLKRTKGEYKHCVRMGKHARIVLELVCT